ncbi:MAG: hypothetical protein IH984_07475 [Planctomycetes bacterium]|nr:hypothetical protein [Planctomycetota bacterium]
MRKSNLITIGICAVFGLLILGGSAQNQAGYQGGRYQLIQLSNMRRDQFMVDTESGMVWQMQAKTIDGEVSTERVFMPVDYKRSDGYYYTPLP